MNSSQIFQLPRSWTTELGVWCRLVMGQRRILLIVASISKEPQQHDNKLHQQHNNPVKTFEKRLRTCKVDVDSRGRPCKERMAKVLCESKVVLSDVRPGSFEVCEAGDLGVAFAAMGLSSLYEQYVSLRSS